MFNLTDCGFSNSTTRLISTLYFISFAVLLPIYISIGLLLNLILLLAFVEQTKTQTSYSYQLIVICSKTFENVVFGAYMVSAYWLSGMYEDKVDWFRRSYTLLVIGVRVGLFLYYFAIYNSLFVSVATAADRAFAIWRPFQYKSINRAAHRSAAVAISMALAFGLCSDYPWYYEVKSEQTWYVVGTNRAYVGSLCSKILKEIRTPIRMMSMIALVFLNLLIFLGHKRRMKNLEKISSINDRDKAQARKEANKELLVLTVCQCFLTFIDQIPNTCMDVLAHSSDYWARCGFALAPVSNGSIMVSDSLEFVIIIAVNKKMRQKVMRVLKRLVCCSKSAAASTSQVATIASASQPNRLVAAK